jgi:very-short-patch-repair endonuclease
MKALKNGLRGIVTGQSVDSGMVERAAALRKEMTATEGLLWARIRAGRLEGFHFRRQQVIGRYIADFYCHTVRLVVEVDGSSHADQERHDRKRDEEIQALGLRVLRISSRDVVENLERVLGEILRACEERVEQDSGRD